MKQHLVQGTPEWLAMRRNYVMASDAATIMNGQHFGKTPYMLWQEKLGLGKKVKDNWAMAQGRMKEEPARRAYERYTSNLVTPEVVYESHEGQRDEQRHPRVLYGPRAHDATSTANLTAPHQARPQAAGWEGDRSRQAHRS